MRLSAARRRRAAENFDYLGELIPPLTVNTPRSPEGPEGEGGVLTVGILLMLGFSTFKGPVALLCT